MLLPFHNICPQAQGRGASWNPWDAWSIYDAKRRGRDHWYDFANK